MSPGCKQATKYRKTSGWTFGQAGQARRMERPQWRGIALLGEGQREQTRHSVRCGPGGECSPVDEEWGRKEKMNLRDLECSVIALDLGHYWSLRPRKILKITCLFQEEAEEG